MWLTPALNMTGLCMKTYQSKVRLGKIVFFTNGIIDEIWDVVNDFFKKIIFQIQKKNSFKKNCLTVSS
jgi:hypothetical protein